MITIEAVVRHVAKEPHPFESMAYGETEVTFTPLSGLALIYDDNIFLDQKNKKSDWITTVTAKATLDAVSRITRLNVSYSPILANYANHSRLNTIRHRGVIDFSQEIYPHLEFLFADTFIQSEDPLEADRDSENIRRFRNTYYTNIARPGIRYVFGPRNDLNTGYIHSILKNENKEITNVTEQGPFASLDYWLNIRNGFYLSASQSRIDYENERGLPVSDDLDRIEATLRYIKKFSIRNEVFIGYNFSGRDFDGDTEDYHVHSFNAGYQHSLSAFRKFYVDAGHYYHVNKKSKNRSGIQLNTQISEEFHRGGLSLNAGTGWDEDFIDTDPRGFTRFWTVGANFNYKLQNNLNFFMGTSYRRNDPLNAPDYSSLRGNIGARWTFFRWFSLQAVYTYRERFDGIPENEYTNNRIAISFSAEKSFHWQ